VVTQCGSSNICWNRHNTSVQSVALFLITVYISYYQIMKYNKKNCFTFFMGPSEKATVSVSNSGEHKMQNCKNWDFNVHYTENNWQKLFIRMNCHALINWYIIHLAHLFNSKIRANRVHNILWRRTVCLCFNRYVKLLVMYQCTLCNRPTDRKQDYLM